LNTIQYSTISFIEDDKNKNREISADTAANETYYMVRSCTRVSYPFGVKRFIFSYFL